MKDFQAADTTFAIIGAVCWSVQVIPQIIKSHRTKSTEGLAPLLMLTWALATCFQGAYLIAQHSSIPLQIQPQCFGFLGAVSWAQCLRYGKNYSISKSLLCLGVYLILHAGFEVGSVYVIWAGENNDTEAPSQVYGWIASALLAAGLIPEYYEIYKHREVIGISLLLMVVDMSGGIFSAISLLFRAKFDYTAFVQYALIVVLDGVVLILAAVLNPRAKKRREREAVHKGVICSEPTTAATSTFAPEEMVLGGQGEIFQGRRLELEGGEGGGKSR